MTIRWVPAWEAELLWGECEPYIQRALDRANGEWTSKDILQSLHEGTMQLWVHDPERVCAIGVTTITQYPQKKIMEVLLAGSDDKRERSFWAKSMNILKLWAKEQGCKSVRITGRGGWARYFPKKYEVMELEI